MPYTYSASRLRAARAMEWVAAGLFRVCRLLRSPEGDVREPGSILLVEPFQMGDVVSLSVMLDPLKERFPDAEITIFTQAKSAEVYDGDARVGHTVTCPVPWGLYRGKRGSPRQWHNLWKTLRRLRRAGFDAGLDPRGDIRSQIVMVLAGCRRRIAPTNYLGSNMVIRGRLLTDSLGCLPVMHRYQINLRVLEPLLGTGVPTLSLPSLKYARIEPESPPPGHQRVVIHVGGGWRFKRWPSARWAALIEGLQGTPLRSIVLVGGPGEADVVNEVQRALPTACDARTTSFRELVGLIKGADLFIGLDSGPMNLAVSLGRPVIALFGPGDSETWYPLGPGDVLFHVREGYPCNPCFQRECVFPERSCMTRIGVEEVLAAAERRLAAAAGA